jgi:L-malate glycosyltransferase
MIINYEYPPIGGGGGFVTRDINEHMAALGHDVTVITSHYKDLPKREIVNGVEILRVPVFFRSKMEVANMPSMACYIPAGIFKALLNSRIKKYDIINTHFAVPSGPVGFLLSKILKVPNVLTIHGGDIFDPSKGSSPHRTPVVKQAVRYLMQSADRVVAQSNDTMKNAKRYYDLERKIDIIPLGIRKPVYHKQNREYFGIENDIILFCTIGRLVKRKNIEETLSILSGMTESLKFQFLIIGDGPEKANLQIMALRLGLEKKVLFLGNVSDEVKFQLLYLSDCYLSTALHEGFGLVFLEAMECGLPIICYNRGGHNDFLIDGVTGYLVEFGDKKTYHEKILNLANNLELKSSISSHNRKHVRKYYIDSCAENYLSLFENILVSRQSVMSRIN